MYHFAHFVQDGIKIDCCSFILGAAPGEDYIELTTELVFSISGAVHCANITILDDDILEATESFYVFLSQGVNDECLFSQQQIIVEILEDPSDSTWLSVPIA